MKFPEKWYLVLTDENIEEVVTFFEENKDYFVLDSGIDIKDTYESRKHENDNDELICFEFEDNEYLDLCHKSKLYRDNNTELTLKDIASIIKEKKEILANILANLTTDIIKEKEIGVICENYDEYCKFCKLLGKEEIISEEENWYNDDDYIWYWDNDEETINGDCTPYAGTSDDKPRIVINFKDIKLNQNHNLIYY